MKLRPALFILAHEGPEEDTPGTTTARMEATRTVGRYITAQEKESLETLWQGRRTGPYLKQVERVKTRLTKQGDL